MGESAADVCEEYQQLSKELESAVQLCAEYDSPFVLAINSRGLTAGRMEQLRVAAAVERKRVESRVFIHLCTCFFCLRAP